MKKILILTTLLSAFACGLFAAGPAVQQTPAPSYASSYKLRPMDVLSFTILQEQDMNRLPVRIASDGYITLPLVEKVYASGLTVDQARERLVELYKKDYFVNPQIDLYIMEYSKQSCYVTGEVAHPSEYVFPPEEADTMTITKVIAGCGGFTRLADRRNVKVKRRFADGKEQVYTINVRSILRDPDSADFPIVNGDVVEVTEDII